MLGRTRLPRMLWGRIILVIVITCSSSGRLHSLAKPRNAELVPRTCTAIRDNILALIGTERQVELSANYILMCCPSLRVFASLRHLRGGRKIRMTRIHKKFVGNLLDPVPVSVLWMFVSQAMGRFSSCPAKVCKHACRTLSARMTDAQGHVPCGIEFS